MTERRSGIGCSLNKSYISIQKFAVDPADSALWQVFEGIKVNSGGANAWLLVEDSPSLGGSEHLLMAVGKSIGASGFSQTRDHVAAMRIG